MQEFKHPIDKYKREDINPKSRIKGKNIFISIDKGNVWLDIKLISNEQINVKQNISIKLISNRFIV